MEWYYYDRKEVSTWGCLIAFVILLISLIGIMLFLRVDKPNKEAPKVQLDEEKVCVNLLSSVLYDELNANAAEYFDIAKPSRVFGGDFIIRSKESQVAQNKFDEIFSTSDSITKNMSEDYNHIFKYDASQKEVCMGSHGNGKYTSVPAWLLVRLINNGMIVLPTNE